MRVLGIDASAQTGGAALIEDGRLAGQTVADMERRHAERLTPALDALMRLVGWTPRSLDLVCVSAGPGSFTGVRIGMSCAKALAYACGLPLVCVPSLDAAAHRYRYARRPVCVLFDARKNEVYEAHYRPSAVGCELERVGPMRCRSIEETVKSVQMETLFVGSGAETYGAQILSALGELARFNSGPTDWISPSDVAAVGELAYSQNPKAYRDIHAAAPIYIRKPEAELAAQQKDAS